MTSSGQRLTTLAEQEFSRDGLRQVTAVCRIMAIKNPLLKRGLSLRASYVFGQGVQVSARAGQEAMRRLPVACSDVTAALQGLAQSAADLAGTTLR
ncbi:hypothetical protein [Actinomadura coerulea]|uniref:hypothetical protein n=1 Tax=Actinomadura coerulea TaxID=46159 RepID=UPI00342C5C3B